MHTRYEMYRTRKQKHTLLKLVGKQKQFLQGCAGFGPTRAQAPAGRRCRAAIIPGRAGPSNPDSESPIESSESLA